GASPRGRAQSPTGAGLIGRYTHQTAKFEKKIAPSETRYDPPPYSCTRVRALKGGGVTSVVRPSGVRRTITHLPASAGRLSIQYTSFSSSCISPRPMVPETIRSEVIGD